MSALKYGMVDADQHYYEPDDCFTRHLQQRFIDEGRTVHVRREPGRAEGRIFMGDEKVTFFGANPCDSTGRPGALLDYFEAGGGTGKMLLHGGAISADDLPPSRSRTSRLEWLDEVGVEAALLFPTIAVGVEHQLERDVEAMNAGLEAFNRWIEEDWGYGGDQRLFGVPLLNLTDMDWAVHELERVVGLGARAVHLKAGPVARKWSPADPRHDPFWARCQEADVAVSFHLGNSGETEYYSSLWGESMNPPNHRYTPFQRVTSFGERAISDTLLALVTHNLFGRFPRLAVLSIEFGCEWVRPLVKKMDRAARMCGPSDWPFGAVSERPRDIFRRHIKVSPYPEDDIVALIELLGADAVLGGSDWPHPEGVKNPTQIADAMIGKVSDEDVEKVMRLNASEILGLHQPATR